MDPDLGDHTAEHELQVARHLVASIFYVPQFAPPRVVVVIGEMPREASHPRETIVKSLPCGEASRHASRTQERPSSSLSLWRGAGYRQTDPKMNSHSAFRAEAPSVAPNPGGAALVQAFVGHGGQQAACQSNQKKG